MPAGPGPDGTCGSPPQSCFTQQNIAWHNANVINEEAEFTDLQNQLTTQGGVVTAAKAARDHAVNNACPM